MNVNLYNKNIIKFIDQYYIIPFFILIIYYYSNYFTQFNYYLELNIKD